MAGPPTVPDTTGAPARSRQVRFVPTAPDGDPRGPDAITVVLDAAWTPRPPDAPGPVAIRPVFSRVVEGRDLFQEALDRLDAWAEAADLPARLLVEGVAYWPRMREPLWRWLHERLLWQHALADILGEPAPSSIAVPAEEPALIDVVRARGDEPAIEPSPEVDAIDPEADGPGIEAARTTTSDGLRGWLRRLVRRSSPRERRPGSDATERHLQAMAQRVERMSTSGERLVLVLAFPSSFQPVGASGATVLRDPNLSGVIGSLPGEGASPVLIGSAMTRPGRAERLAAEQDDRLIPAYIVRGRWSRPEDQARAERAVESVAGTLADLAVPLAVDGVDLAPLLIAELRTSIERIVRTDIVVLARAERMLDELRPRAVLMTHEGQRTPWLVAADARRIPTFALQHGVLYPTHPSYSGPRDPRQPLPTLTFVYGDYERRVLLEGPYRSEEVAVSGSPRLDLDATATTGLESGRDDVRRDLGVAPGDRMLVISTMPPAFIRRSHLANMLDRLLGGPLPGVHVVFKQHPGEADEGPYRRLLEGMADARGYPPPPISVVKVIDLYRLLRAADAHLGLHSTVLTDAVAAGTPNLIATVDAHADLLGYVDAGVATPVGDIDDLRAALADPRPADPARRQAFLDDHFLPGDASARIAARIREVIDAAID